MGTPASYGRIDFKVADAPRPGLTVTALPLQPLRAEIHKDFTASSDSGQGIETVSGNGNGGFSNINLNLIPADNLFENPFGGNLRRPDGASDGDVYEMDGVTPGRYWVQAMTPEGYVSSMTSGQTDLMQEPLTIGAGESGAPIEITLRNDTGTIACTVNAPSKADSRPWRKQWGNAAGFDLRDSAVRFDVRVPGNHWSAGWRYRLSWSRARHVHAWRRSMGTTRSTTPIPMNWRA